MTPTKDALLDLADAYKAAAGIERDTTLSYRMFGDSKKLRLLREGGDITLTRYHAAIEWLLETWPEGHPVPAWARGGRDRPLAPADDKGAA